MQLKVVGFASGCACGFAAAMIVLVLASPAAAQTLTWDGQQSGSPSDGSGTWINDGTTVNWNNGAPVVWSNGNDAAFGAGTPGAYIVDPRLERQPGRHLIQHPGLHDQSRRLESVRLDGRRRRRRGQRLGDDQRADRARRAADVDHRGQPNARRQRRREQQRQPAHPGRRGQRRACGRFERRRRPGPNRRRIDDPQRPELHIHRPHHGQQRLAHPVQRRQ